MQYSHEEVVTKLWCCERFHWKKMFYSIQYKNLLNSV